MVSSTSDGIKPPPQHLTAEQLSASLHGSKVGNSWTACCPSHEDVTPSLSISSSADGKVLVHCHTGCDQATVIDALRARGLWNQPGQRAVRSVPSQKPENKDNQQSALRLWQKGAPAIGTLVQTYLESRGLTLPAEAPIRFLPLHKHPSGGSWPTMLSLVQSRDNVPQAIHRTFLARDGSTKAPVQPNKMMLGKCAGGSVHLGQPKNGLMISEGIETGISAMQATGFPTWAALSTAGLRALELPDSAKFVVILADGDEPGEEAAIEAATRWQSQGRNVKIARPPKGQDLNDILLSTKEGEES